MLNRPLTDEGRAKVLRAYILAVAMAGVCVLVDAALSSVRAPHPFAWLALAAIAVATGSFKLNFAGNSADIAIDDTFYMAIAILFGPGPATVAIAAGGFALPVRRRRPLRQIVFNTASLALSMWAASSTFFLIAQVDPLAISRAPMATLVLPLLALCVVYFVFNTGLMATVIGLDTRTPPLQIWRAHFQWLSVSFFGAASLAFCLVLLLQQASMAALVIVLPLLAIFHLTLRASFGRLDDANRHLSDMDRLYLSTIETLAMAIDAKDDVTHDHVRRVQTYASGLAKALGVADELTLKALAAAALLHDTGKLAVPERILNKPGKLTPSEFEKMKLHVDIGADILSLVEFPFPVVPIVRCHHENWDGSGYPRGVKGDDIPIGARILSVVDCFDALTSDRPYRRRMTDEEALGILRERSGKMYDPAVVEMFTRVYRELRVEHEPAPAHEVLQRVSASRVDDVEPATNPSEAIAADLLAFVSLARVASGDAGVSDVLALSSNLMQNLAPGVTGVWYLVDEGQDRLVAQDAFGPAASTLRNTTFAIGDRLTGWVASTHQPILGSDANLDLGSRAEMAVPALTRCVAVPLLKGDRLAGVLSLYASDPAVLTEERGRLAQMIAPHLASAISAARGTVPPARDHKPAERVPVGASSRETRVVAH
ncbi:MAG TPA: HD domain-containing phosphohydrolase [Vicinamibacterales bacterium]|nr:HD domain-containing phosphohydrolase [Vicinamibacterales bacterium]